MVQRHLLDSSSSAIMTFLHLGDQIACSMKQTKGMFKFSPSAVYFGDMILELIMEQVTVISQKKRSNGLSA